MNDSMCHIEGLNKKNISCSKLVILIEEIGQMTSVSLPQSESHQSER